MPSRAFKRSVTFLAQCMQLMPSILMMVFMGVSSVWGSLVSGSLECSEAWGSSLGLKFFRRRALVTTDTELIAMAAAANMGFRVGPPNRWNSPAARGMPAEL